MNEDHVQQLIEWISDAVDANEPTHTFDFLSGLSQFAIDFAICKDGERYFGSRPYTTREFNEALRRYMEKQA